MFALIQHHGITLAVCVLLGAATSWWMYRGERGAKKDLSTQERKEP